MAGTSDTGQPTDVSGWRDRDVVDRDGNKVGKLEQIYLDTDTNTPEWALVNTGLFGTKSSFVPLAGASPAGDEVRIDYTKDQVKDAPAIDPEGELSQAEEETLYRHYGHDYTERRSESGLPAGEGAPAGAGRATDEAMTRAEEELRVGTAERERGRVRLRKWVETEVVEHRVPIRREKVRLEREPITDENVEPAIAGPEISEAEHEVVLREEEPVVEKRVVPKERVRLEKDVETDEARIEEEVRKERIETEGDTRS
jgi:uncharacterized protein (TIGR02271 family)